MTWRDHAACKGMNPNVFFPEGGNSHHGARAVCDTCPVRRPCSQEGREEEYGVWGGMTPQERNRGRSRINATSGVLRCLSDGEWWYSSDISNECGLSRNTIQKALRRLTSEGVVEVQQLGCNVNKWRWPVAAREHVHDVVTSPTGQPNNVHTMGARSTAGAH